jgi:hypothetical protein
MIDDYYDEDGDLLWSLPSGKREKKSREFTELNEVDR